MIRTRFAPSPTGVLHLGSVRTALFNWLYAHHKKGICILRIEDTDKERSTEENVQAILDGMEWLGIKSDNDPIYQSEKWDRYQEVADQWLNSGDAYHCYCSKDELNDLRKEQMSRGEKARYDGRCRDLRKPLSDRDPVIRFKNPLNGEVVVNDRVHGKVVFQNSELDDLIIVRSDGTPTYNFTVVVDDSDMKITHVIRGDDHLNNTPRQMNMLQVLGVSPPQYAHLPMILGEDGAKLSKRHGAIDIRDYRDKGYLPEAMLNYLVRLGWSHGNQEIFSLEEMTDFFDLSKLTSSASIFNPGKLLWLNQYYIMNLPVENIRDALSISMKKLGIDHSGGPDLISVVKVFRERAETMLHMAESCRYCYEDFKELDPKSVKKHLRPVILEPLKSVSKKFNQLSEWSSENIESCIKDTVASYDITMGKLGQPLRVAVTGGSVSPPIDKTIWLIGKDRILRRLEQAIKIIEKKLEN